MPKRVLIVEDEQHIVESLRFLLEREGFAVRAISDGAAALDTVMEYRPDLVVLDAMLPGVDGFEILHRLRTTMSYQHLPILMLTARGQKKDRLHAESRGVSVFMTKPYSNAGVIDAVRGLLSE